ncbi:type II toxin-antitoxin system VapC family toxin [Sphingomonas sp. CL5.1]|uniref:type II toxin-antitoxin system VapC family toxin n=1 Tax=Sphingomonas sp. CL5.1 TaxID=2653203 RepID=UPI00158175E5|nr:type II toxin-antitoxin system VapC family toxin [Sphingomonas sp. CL5.1]QKR99750.1 type II toxin-antitoxin system VapC family toxin [Sphingomonas sp. CL5.1]
MIAIDTSAIMAILMNESEADSCIAVIEAEDEIVISSGTLAETLIVAGRRNVGEEAALLLDGLGLDVAPVTPGSAKRTADAYGRWGKGVHPAGLNFGDCFAYEIAMDRDCPLLFVGEDFSKTDVGDARAGGSVG